MRTAFTLRFVADRMRRAVAEALKEDITTWCEFAALTVACELSGLSQNGLAERAALLPLNPRERARLWELLAKAIPHDRGLFGF
jgi:hypothetical protein